MASRTRTGSAGQRQGRGFSYVLLLVLIAVLGLFSAGAVSIGHAASRQQAEAELLAIGVEFRDALLSYGASASSAQMAGPAELKHLLRDPRIPGVRRHLRKIYADPLTGGSEWGLVRAPNGRIMGVYSLATGVPAKQTGFDPVFQGFEGATSYSQWVFAAHPVVQTPGGMRIDRTPATRAD